MAQHMVCPWWIGYFLVSPLRRIVQSPARILSGLVSPGMTVLEPGPGMGFFTLELARLVGPSGRVVAVDLQPKMLRALERRARRARLADRIEARVAGGESLGVEDLAGRVDFVLAFAMVHELPSPARFFAEAHRALVPGGTMLLSEPAGHVRERGFADTLALAEATGFAIEARPTIWKSHSALLRRA